MMPTPERSRHLAAELEAVYIGQHQVQQDHVGRLGLQQLEGSRPVRGHAGVEAAHDQVAPDEVDDVGVVFHQQGLRPPLDDGHATVPPGPSRGSTITKQAPGPVSSRLI